MKLFDFNIFNSILKKDKKKEEIKEDDLIAQYKFIRRMTYIKARYPNYPNSDYIRLLERMKEKNNK